MNPRENLLSLYRREGYQTAPVSFHLCPSLEEEAKRRYPDDDDYMESFGMPHRIIFDPGFSWNLDERWRIPSWKDTDWSQFFPKPFDHPVEFDIWGVAHEKGSKEAQHMTRMHYPMQGFTTLKEMEDYPWPDIEGTDFSYLIDEVDKIHDRELAVFVWGECTIWETAWYMRSMDNLMMDMAMNDEKAHYILDRITDLACIRAKHFANADVDILGLGDDIGMQESIMMSEAMYREWLKPRLAKVIAAAREVKPDIIIQYHSCGYVEPFIGDLIEVGVDVLNPVQPECMDFLKIHDQFGDRLSFNGTLGTQKVMPFGTVEDVINEVERNLRKAGDRGGLFCCPTHMLEPEVPWENIEAYARACREFKA